jgi:hypothetical protein
MLVMFIWVYIQTGQAWKISSKGRRFNSHSGKAYFSSLPGLDIHSEYNITSIIFTRVHYTNTEKKPQKNIVI